MFAEATISHISSSGVKFIKCELEEMTATELELEQHALLRGHCVVCLNAVIMEVSVD